MEDKGILTIKEMYDKLGIDDIFKTSIGYERESDWLKVEKTEQEINKQIVSYIKRKGDTKLLRELKLRQLLYEV